MQITQRTDYVLRVLMYLDINSHRLINISEISETFSISLSHLTKVVAQLTKEEYVTGKRGKGGGIYLARPATDINLGEVFRNFEALDLVECHTEQNSCFITPNCRLKSIFGQATKAFVAILDQYSLADLTNNQNLQQQLNIDKENQILL